MMKDLGFNFLTNLTLIIPQLLIVSACIYYLTKKITVEGILLFLGSLIGLAGTIFHVVVMPYLYHKNIIDPFSGNITIMTFIGLINFFASLAFAIGLFMLIYNTVLVKKVNH